jgi:fumarate hydratase subunit alpha
MLLLRYGVLEGWSMDLNLLEKAIAIAETSLKPDVEEALRRALEVEEDETARANLRAILENVEYARKAGVPMCQDTGLHTFFVEVGYDFPERHRIKEMLTEAVRRATKRVPLRPNTVNPFTGENPGDNTGRHVPYIHWEFVEGDALKITLLPKGGGSENMSALAMLRPGDGIEGLKRFVIRRVAEAAGKPCPPTILGIGIGGGADIALELAKRALLRPIGERADYGPAAELEEYLIEKINSLGIGPMGMGGKTTVLDVHIEWAHRHPATFPVGLVFQCWAHRYATVIVKGDRIEVV